MIQDYDVIIIGGSYAGLSAAMALGRSLRKVLVVDSGNPCNKQTPHSHNFLTQDGKTPAKISQIARQQILAYETVTFLADTAIQGEKIAKGFSVKLQSGKAVSARKLIFATGIKDLLPDIQGFSSCWGISVVHCPYCHGYELRGKKTAILANGENAMHYAMLVGNLTKHLQIFTNGAAEFSADQIALLNKHRIPVHELKITNLVHENGNLKTVQLENGDAYSFEAMYFRPTFKQHSELPHMLGITLNEQGYIAVDATQKTNIDGAYACGDNSSMMRSVANAVAAGNMAGAVVNRELVMEEFR